MAHWAKGQTKGSIDDSRISIPSRIYPLINAMPCLEGLELAIWDYRLRNRYGTWESGYEWIQRVFAQDLAKGKMVRWPLSGSLMQPTDPGTSPRQQSVSGVRCRMGRDETPISHFIDCDAVQQIPSGRVLSSAALGFPLPIAIHARVYAISPTCAGWLTGPLNRRWYLVPAKTHRDLCQNASCPSRRS